MDNLGKIGRSLMNNWWEIRQLINILFCGYQRRLEIADPLNGAETYTRLGHSEKLGLWFFVISIGSSAMHLLLLNSFTKTRNSH
jgi:hypothetical protein